MKIFLFAGPAVLVLIVFLFLLRYGGFSPIRFGKGHAGGETVVYEEGRGDYRKSGELMDSIYQRLIETESIETFRGFGIFYDNPKNVPADTLRYEAGCILEEPSEATVKRLESDFQVKTIEPRECITAVFPYRGKPSVFLGTIRVYPALSRYIRDHNLPEAAPIMEIYDVPAGKIVYRKFLE
ncbi:MAG: GyrI-like domain-containing protein [Spirochaetaceae bacterium]